MDSSRYQADSRPAVKRHVGRPKLWEERRSELLDRVMTLRDKGLSLRQIATELRISKSSAFNLLREAGQE